MEYKKSIPMGVPPPPPIIKQHPKGNLTGDNLLIDYRLQQTPFLGARYIFECGVKLDAEPMTVATACLLYHRFFKAVDMKDYDIYIIGSTSLYLAGKIEEQCLKIRDVVNVAYATIHRDCPPLDLGEKFWSFRDAITQAELLMIRILSFRVIFTPPHKFLVHNLKTLEEWMGCESWTKAPVSRTAWALLQDFHHDSAVLEFPPQAVAVAAITLAMEAYGAQVPLCSFEGKNSWQEIMYTDLRPSMQEEIMGKMLKVYEYELDLFPHLVYQKNGAPNGK